MGRVVSSLAVIVVLSLTAAVAGCSESGSGNATGPAGDEAAQASTTPTGPSGGELVWANSADSALLDPHLAADYLSWEMLDLAYDTLIGPDDDLSFVPQLAESWEQTSPTTYRFDIRQDAKFSNGRPMTVDDVVGSLRRLVSPKTASYWASQLGDVKSIEKVGDWQVEVELVEPRRTFLPALASINAAILPMKELRAGTYDPKKDVLGTGPFKVEDHKQNESWTFARNPHYWRKGFPKPDKLVVRIMPEDAARVAGLRDGSIDVATFDAPDSMQLLEGQANIDTVSEDTTLFWVLNVNGKSSLFRDARLRQALSLSLDRNKINDLALGGLGTPTATVPPHYDACDPEALPYGKPDPERARELVDEAGARGKKVTVLVPTLLGTASGVAQVIQRDLEETGLDVTLEKVDLGELLRRQDSGDFDLVVGLSGTPDPAIQLSFQDPATTGWGGSWWKSDKEIIDHVNTILREPADSDRYEDLLRKACELVARDSNGEIPLVTSNWIVGYRPDQVSARIQPLEGYSIPLRHIEEFSVAN